MEIWGWIGAIIYIVSYLFLSLQWLSSRRYLYHVLNLLGAACLIVNAWFLSDYPNVFVNIAWALIAFLAMYKLNAKVVS